MNPTRLLLTLASALLLLAGSGCTSTPTAAVVLPPLASTNKYAKELMAFEAKDAANPPPKNPIVFTGSSSFRLWTNVTTDFPNLGIVNTGFGGSQLSDVREHFERVILKYQPRQVLLYCGGNDLNAKKSVAEVVGDLKAVVERIHREMPKTQVTYVSIALNPARWTQRGQILQANAEIKKFMAEDRRRAYVDITAAMLGADGEPKPDIFVADKLHMNRKGYELWIPVLRPHLLTR